ncbi:hypothetical protein [Streptomyces sp. NPDC058665]|uniref:hypothetical protein n=1 Tax=Streptomyces sp. NPDC058665 TaxID=3346586 RepID=UPI0036539357
MREGAGSAGGTAVARSMARMSPEPEPVPGARAGAARRATNVPAPGRVSTYPSASSC